MANNLEQLAKRLVKDLNALTKETNKQINIAINSATPEQRQEIAKQLKEADVKAKFEEIKQTIQKITK